jgi:predicted TIM-barrel fold metal-dependent hydrolase
MIEHRQRKVMYSGPIIDSHMHLWDLANGYAWLNGPDPTLERLIGNYDALRHNFLPPDYAALIRGHNVLKSVHVQAFGFPENPAGETAWLQAQADRYGYPHGIVAFADLSDPDVEDTLRKHRAYRNVRGIRVPLNFDQAVWRRMTDRGDYMRDAQWRRGFALLSRYDLSFDVQIYDHQAPDAADLARAFPETTLIVEHLGWPITNESALGFEHWAERLTLLAECPNVFLKASGVGCVFHGAEPALIRQYLHRAVAIFGPQRCLFGSNCPPDTLFYDFSALLAAYADAFSDLTPEAQRAVFCDNAQRVYRL